MILAKIAGSNFSVVQRVLVDRVAVVIGGGSSLTEAQVDQVCKAGVACIAVNDAYLWAPFANMLYAADQHWWDAHSKGVDKSVIGIDASAARLRFHAFTGQRCTIQPTNNTWPAHDVYVLRNMHHPYHGTGLSSDPEQVVTGRNSGWQAINILALAGARVVILLGFDGKASSNGKSHWHGGHAKPTPQQAYEEYRRACSAGETALTRAGVRVVNCSPGSAIDSFQKLDLKAALCL